VTITYERLGACAVLTIDRPERRNAVDGATAEAMLDAYRDFEREPGPGCSS
jgi:enoyl-CoA hydratase